MADRKKKTARRIPIDKFPFTPLTYPGKRPNFSFLFTPKGIYTLKVPSLDRALAMLTLAPTAERYAVLAYGSNACPGQLLEKGFSDVPVIYGRLHGAEAVYAGRTNSRGYVPATIARKKGSGCSWITLLTKPQLKQMDISEGRRGGSYALAELYNVRFLVGRRTFAPLYGYVNIDRGVMTVNGKPVPLRSMRQRRAKATLETASRNEASSCLDYTVIPYPEAPAEYSQLLRAGR
ncbi:MAG: hypothetical protein L0Z53_23490 [Acidobacteriales bacterium]|nr:hypothetical protein [Terriglobales bacterium]